MAITGTVKQTRVKPDSSDAAARNADLAAELAGDLAAVEIISIEWIVASGQWLVTYVEA